MVGRGGVCCLRFVSRLEARLLCVAWCQEAREWTARVTTTSATSAPPRREKSKVNNRLSTFSQIPHVLNCFMTGLQFGFDSIHFDLDLDSGTGLSLGVYKRSLLRLDVP